MKWKDDESERLGLAYVSTVIKGARRTFKGSHLHVLHSRLCTL
jgi:hypothetical protein